MKCLVCDKPIKRGLYDEPESQFCNSVCAIWFARAVVHTVFLCGDEYRKIDTWLGQYTQVIKKRGQAKQKRSTE